MATPLIINVAINDTIGRFQARVFDSIHRAALNRGVTLLVIEGRSLASGYYSENQHNLLYRLLDNDRAQSTVVYGGTIFPFASENAKARFKQWLGSQKAVYVQYKMEGEPCIVLDNYGAQKAIVEHLIEVHGIKKIAYMSGPPGSEEAQDRRRGYIDCLSDNGIPFRPEWIIEGDFREVSAHDNFEQIVSVGQTVEAMAFASDGMALETQKLLKEHAPDLLGRLAVVGFDNCLSSCLVKPQLTTVAIPLDKLCSASIDVSIKLIEGCEDIPLEQSFCGEVIPRESCGCGYQRITALDLHDQDCALRIMENIYSYDIETIFESLTTSLRGLDVRSFYVCIYNSFLSEKGNIPTSCKLIYAFHQGQRAASSLERDFETRIILPDELFHVEEGRVLLMKPMFFGADHFGYTISDATNVRPEGLEAIHRHITALLKTSMMFEEQREISRKLKQAEQLAKEAERYKSNFISTMSHELRTPVVGIIGMINSIISSKDISTLESDLTQAANAADYLLTLVNDIMDATQLESGGLELREEEFCLETLCKSVATIANERASEKNLRFNMALKLLNNDIRVGDSQRLKQVLLNLLSNAVKFTENGFVALEIIEHNNESISFSVKDTGIGMQKNTLDRVKRIFEQENSELSRSYSGLGVGLAISCCIVQLMGGVLDISSEVGEGSLFSFVAKFPRARRTPVGKLEEGLGLPTIMVVDDQPLNRKIISRMLTNLGCEVVIAKDGFDALIKYNEEHPPSFVLMDIQMPRLDGLSATEQMRKAGITTPVIALTANVATGIKGRCLEVGMNEYIVKPVSIERLQELLVRYAVSGSVS